MLSLIGSLVIVEVVILIFYLVPLAIFYRYRHIDILATRRFPLVAVTTICEAIICCWYFTDFGPFANTPQIPCVVGLLVSALAGPMIFFPFFIKALELIYTNNLNQARLNESTAGAGARHKHLRHIQKLSIRFFQFFQKTTAVNGGFSYEKINVALKLSGSTLLKALTPFLALEILLLLFPLVIFSDSLLLPGCLTNLIYAPSLVLIIILLCVIPYLLYMLNHVKDGLGLRVEYSVNLAMLMILYILNMINLFVDQLIFSRAYTETFGILAVMGSHVITVIYPLILVYLHHDSNAHLKLDRETYMRVLSTPDLLFKLKQLMASELTLEHIMFIEEVSLLDTLDTQEHPKIVADIYKKYIQNGGSHQINVSEDYQAAVKESVEKPNASVDVFDDVLAEVNELVYRNSFARFIKLMPLPITQTHAKSALFASVTSFKGHKRQASSK